MSPIPAASDRAPFTRTLFLLSLSAALLAGSVARAESRAPYALVLDGPGKSVVAVRYQLRPKERPKGGEGPKIRKITAGVISGPAGQVIINASSFPDADEGADVLQPFDFRVVTEDGSEMEAEATGLARDLNLAFLRVTNPEMLKAPSVSFADAPGLEIGDEVIVVGLLAEPYAFKHAAYRAHLNGQPPGKRTMFSLDITLPDLCGGGLVTLPDGRPVGFVGLDLLPEAWENAEPGNLLSLFGSANQGQRPGYLMVYPAALFTKVLDAPPVIETDDREKQGWLGITMQPLSRDLGDYWSISAPGGVILGAVLAGSPAEHAGLQPGDVILGIDGELLPIRETKDLSLIQKTIRRAGAGRDIPLKIWRNGEQREVSVKLSPTPTTVATAEEYENDDFGITVRELTYDVIQSLNLGKETQGVYVSKTDRAGWAQVAGIDRGDIILKVDGAAISSLVSFRHALDKARTERRAESSFLLLRSYKTRFVRIQTNWKLAQVHPSR